VTDEPGEAGTTGAAGATVASALRSLEPPEHAPTFWDDLDRRLADEPQLRLAPRAAIRPITQPPPVIDDRLLAEHLADPRPRQRRSMGRMLVWGLAIALIALLIAAALQDPEPETSTADSTATTATDGRAPTSEDTTTTVATTAPAGAIDPRAVVSPEGVGPLTINTSMRELQAAGLPITVDQATFDASGGSCWDAKVTDAVDLTLRFRSPFPGDGVEDPADGVLVAVGIESTLPTSRTSNTGIGLGAPQDQVLGTYAGNISDHNHPFVPGGHIYIASVGQGTGLGIAYLTDGAVVTGITAGAEDVIRFVDGCL
jgi:hypothetical protein